MLVDVKAVKSGRWRAFPTHSLDVEAGKVYSVPAEYAAFVCKAGAASYYQGETVKEEKVIARKDMEGANDFPPKVDRKDKKKGD